MQCTAKSKRTGLQCRKWAITGKDKCMFHGGKTPINGGANGRYSKYSSNNPRYSPRAFELATFYAQRHQSKTDDLHDELALACALLNVRLQHTNFSEGKDIDAVFAYLLRIERLVGKVRKSDHGSLHKVNDALNNFCNYIINSTPNESFISEFVRLTQQYAEKKHTP